MGYHQTKSLLTAGCHQIKSLLTTSYFLTQVIRVTYIVIILVLSHLIRFSLHIIFVFIILLDVFTHIYVFVLLDVRVLEACSHPVS